MGNLSKTGNGVKGRSFSGVFQLGKADQIIRYELEKWFPGFFPSYDINRLKIISLGER
jgi:hypothetical protein